ncbi:MAG TPA: flagellar export protein FliJ [Steroidobacteraceae bacterium]|nr:flagellar export protein FliJ [Steroidobacteraceae bacterium]
MPRSTRLQPVHAVVEDHERKIARKFAQAEHRLSEAQTKLKELDRYHAEYARGFHQRAQGGIGAAGLRDYQVFLAKLNEAIKQQKSIVQRAEGERELARQEWLKAAQRTKAIAHVMEKWLVEERRALERREQLETDERAQRNRRSDGIT